MSARATSSRWRVLATTAAGATAGIVAGGLLTQYFGWRALFLINPPMIRYTGPAASTLASGTWPTGTLLRLNTATLDNFSA